MEMRDAGDPPAGAGSANNSDTEISEAMDKLTLDGEPIISKRKVFKNFQFLVEEKSGLHVWKSAEVPPNLDLNTVTSIEKPTKEFIAQHKHRYKSMRWIAMSVDDAITTGAGQYPRISVMVEWVGDLKDTLMSRSDLIRVAGQARVDQDLQNHLSYRKMIEFEGRKVFIMSQTDAGLLNGEMKAMQRIKNDQFKAAKAAQTTVAQPAFAQPGFAQPGFVQPAFAQPGFAQPGFVQPAFAQQGVAQPGFVQPGFAQQGVAQPGFVQPGFAQPGVAQPTVSQPAAPQAGATQPAVSQAGVTQAGAAQLGVAQPTQADMIPSSAVQAMIASAVQQALQQYQRQPASVVAA